MITPRSFFSLMAFLSLCLLLSSTAWAVETSTEKKLTKEMVTEFYARSSLIYSKPYEEYIQYLDDIFTADAQYTDNTEVNVPKRKMPPPSTNVYDKAKILELAKPVYDSLRYGGLVNNLKGIYISDDGLSAHVAVKMVVTGIHTPGSDIYFNSSGICQDNLVAGGKYGIMVKSTKCTMTTRQMKDAPPTQKFEKLNEPLKSLPKPTETSQ